MLKYIPLLLLLISCSVSKPEYDLLFQGDIAGHCNRKDLLHCTLHLDQKKISLKFDSRLLKPFQPETLIKYGTKKIPAKQLQCKPKENGFYCMPFLIQRATAIKKITPITLKQLREIPLKNLPDQKEIHLKIETTFPFPSDLRQQCIKENRYQICTLLNGYQLLNTKKPEIKANSSRKLDQLLQQSKLNQSQTPILDTITLLHKVLRYDQTAASENIDEIITQKRGDCTEFSLLGAAILNQLKIPARRVYGLRYNGTAFQFHAWIEYYEKGFWRGFDPVFKTMVLSPGYLLLNRDPDTPFIYPDIRSIEMVK